MASQDRVRHESDVSHLRRLAGLSVDPPPKAPERRMHSVQIPESQARDSVERRIQEVREVYSTPAPRGPLVKCKLCERTIPRQEWSQHLSDPGHARKARLATYHQALIEGTRDKFGINIITGDLDFGIVELDSLKEWPTREDSFYVQVAEEGYWMRNIQMTSSLGSFAEFRDTSFKVRFSAPIPLRSNQEYSLKVTFDPKGNRGRHEDRVEFTFDSPSEGKQFVIVREVKATVTVPAHHQQLIPLGEYIRPLRRPREFKSSVMEGVRPSNFERQKTAFQVRLPEFKIPPELVKIIGRGSAESQVETILDLFPEGLTLATYSDFWQVLLWLEEHQVNKDMENYDQSDTQFSVRLGRNHMYVPVGLASGSMLKLPPTD
ncbi:hypothetical protein FRC01_004651, partial [Tulasnella sp. 417]